MPRKPRLQRESAAPGHGGFAASRSAEAVPGQASSNGDKTAAAPDPTEAPARPTHVAVYQHKAVILLAHMVGRQIAREQFDGREAAAMRLREKKGIP